MSSLTRNMSGALGSKRSQDMDRLTKIFETRGGQKQLIMFVTGLSGARKSTRIDIDQRLLSGVL